MERRGFFKSLAGLCLAPFIPAAKADNGIRYFEWSWTPTSVGLNDGWYCLVHPDIERDIRVMRARDKWREAYSRWKYAGRPEATPRQILDGSYLPTFVPRGDYKGEIGFLDDGIRFIPSKKY